MSKRETATKVKSYTGILNEPMQLPRKSLVGPTPEKQTAQTFEDLLHRVGALFNHYGIDPARHIDPPFGMGPAKRARILASAIWSTIRTAKFRSQPESHP